MAWDADCILSPGDLGELLPSYEAFGSTMLKWVMNAVSTGAQVMKGTVFRNKMVNTGPTNDKIYHRCIRLIEEFASVPSSDARDALLRAIYKDDFEDEAELERVRQLPTSDHIIRATPSGEEDMRKQQTVLPVAILIASGMRVGQALEGLGKQKSIRRVLASI